MRGMGGFALWETPRPRLVRNAAIESARRGHAVGNSRGAGISAASAVNALRRGHAAGDLREAGGYPLPMR